MAEARSTWELTRVMKALPHAFWYHFRLPETKEAIELTAKFFDEKVSH